MIKKIRDIAEGVPVQGVIWLFGLLPVGMASAIGGWLGRTFGPFIGVTSIARRNLAHAMPELQKKQTDAIIRGMWDNLGRTVAEFPHVARMDFHDLAEIEGAEHIINATKSKHSCIFFSGHLANWELMPKAGAAYGGKLMLVYRQANNTLVDAIISKNRDFYQEGMIPKGKTGAKKLVKDIKNGHNIGMLVDQKMNDGIAVPFFGQQAMTAPAIATLALKQGCTLIPSKVVRLKGAHFKVTIYPPMELVKTGDMERDILTVMTDINAMMESWIRENPAQWLWVHKRWPL